MQFGQWPSPLSSELFRSYESPVTGEKFIDPILLDPERADIWFFPVTVDFRGYYSAWNPRIKHMDVAVDPLGAYDLPLVNRTWSQIYPDLRRMIQARKTRPLGSDLVNENSLVEWTNTLVTRLGQLYCLTGLAYTASERRDHRLLLDWFVKNDGPQSIAARLTLNWYEIHNKSYPQAFVDFAHDWFTPFVMPERGAIVCPFPVSSIKVGGADWGPEDDWELLFGDGDIDPADMNRLLFKIGKDIDDLFSRDSSTSPTPAYGWERDSFKISVTLSQYMEGAKASARHPTPSLRPSVSDMYRQMAVCTQPGGTPRTKPAGVPTMIGMVPVFNSTRREPLHFRTIIVRI
jgi:hypothetical protein